MARIVLTLLLALAAPLAWGQAPFGEARAVSAAFGPDGRLWLTWVDGAHLVVSHSDDLGRTLSPPVRVNREPQRIRDHGESRPRIAVDGAGRLFVLYNQKLERRFTGHVRFSRSLDGGKSFSEPVIVHRDRQTIGHAFGNLVVDAEGILHLFWLDGRDAHRAQRLGRPFTGSSLYYTRSSDGGASFEPDRALATGTCQCCRLAVAADGARPLVMWRHIFEGGVRDHALIRFLASGRPGPLRRTPADGWQIDACPHHGPALAVGEGGRIHMVWYSGVERSPGVRYARTTDGGATFSLPLAIPDVEAEHADVAVAGGRVYLAWRGFEGTQRVVRMMVSEDGGQHWSPPRIVARAAGRADQPFLLRRGDRVHLSWYASREGYRLIDVTEAHP